MRSRQAQRARFVSPRCIGQRQRRDTDPSQKQRAPVRAPFGNEMAERTGLEPATSGVTGQHSNQLNYRSALKLFQV